MLETLVALAILSVSALLIFQFVGQQLSLVDRVERLSAVSLAGAMERERFTTVAAALVPAWPESDAEVFRGTPARFTGLSSGQLEAVSPTLSLVSMEIVRDPVGVTSSLIYRSAGATYTIAEFPAPAAFSYLAQNGQWLPDWPTQGTTDPGPFDDSAVATPRPLPVAIRIQVEGGVELDWLALLDWRAGAMSRLQDNRVGVVQ